MDMDTDGMQQGEVGDFVEVNAQRIATGAEITTLATTVSSDDDILIIAGMEDQVIELATLNFNARLTPIFSMQLAGTIPAALAFLENKEDIIVFGLRDGDVYVIIISSSSKLLFTAFDSRHMLKGKDGKILSTRNVGPRM